nr:hypothetical protein [uncultured Rhodopila sp.]
MADRLSWADIPPAAARKCDQTPPILPSRHVIPGLPGFPLCNNGSERHEKNANEMMSLMQIKARGSME